MRVLGRSVLTSLFCFILLFPFIFSDRKRMNDLPSSFIFPVLSSTIFKRFQGLCIRPRTFGSRSYTFQVHNWWSNSRRAVILCKAFRDHCTISRNESLPKESVLNMLRTPIQIRFLLPFLFIFCTFQLLLLFEISGFNFWEDIYSAGIFSFWFLYFQHQLPLHLLPHPFYIYLFNHSLVEDHLIKNSYVS